MGHTAAMEKVAFMYLFGNHLPQNLTLAKELFDKLAMSGSPHGQLVSSLARVTF